METTPADTRTRIVRSAEKLFAEHGIAGTSVRMITDDANANIAAVNYHFGGKDQLIRAIVIRRVMEIDEVRSKGLDALISSSISENRVPSLNEVVRCYLDPIIEHGFDHERGKMRPFVRFLRRLQEEPESFRREVTTLQDPIPSLDLLIRALSMALEIELERSPKMLMAMWYLVNASLQALVMMEREGSVLGMKLPNQDEIRNGAVLFISGGLTELLTADT
ncbi:MAG: helix-turn-helix domain-containing protein [Stappiaceae bacterium]